MNILQVHNFYSSSSPSGENQTVDLISTSLRSIGERISELSWNSDDIERASARERVRLGIRILAAPNGRLLEAVRSIRPDIVQLHNPVPFVSAAELQRVRKIAPVVHVIHNFRHTCLSGSHFREGAACGLCRAKFGGRLHGVVRACYRGSRLQSAALAFEEAARESEWRNLDAYIAISEYMKRYLVSAGFPESRIIVIPNPAPPSLQVETVSNDVLYAGRISPEKGVHELIDAWRACARPPGAILHIAGSGPSDADVSKAVGGDRSITYHGRLSPSDLELLGARCGTSVVPSLWDEPFGRVAIEALSAGRFIVVSQRGGLPEIAQNPDVSTIVEPTVAGLAKGLTRAWANVQGDMRRDAVGVWEANYRPDKVAQRYRSLYSKVVNRA